VNNSEGPVHLEGARLEAGITASRPRSVAKLQIRTEILAEKGAFLSNLARVYGFVKARVCAI
jgi:hypothetical protein